MDAGVTTSIGAAIAVSAAIAIALMSRRKPQDRKGSILESQSARIASNLRAAARTLRLPLRLVIYSSFAGAAVLFVWGLIGVLAGNDYWWVALILCAYGFAGMLFIRLADVRIKAEVAEPRGPAGISN